MTNSYYSDKKEILKDIFCVKEISFFTGGIKIGDKSYPIIDDVIILLKPEFWPQEISEKIPGKKVCKKSDFAEDVQFTFSREWEKFPEILPEHKKEFDMYFDLVNVSRFSGMRVADFGCGIGRWSYFLKDKVKELILLDFSIAIFMARKNLKDAKNAIFFMADIKDLPFRENFADFIFSLGVLHHLETDALDEVKNISKYSQKLLIFLYYQLDNRPLFWRLILLGVTALRRFLCSVRSAKIRSFVTFILAVFVYLPLIYSGKIMDIFKLGYIIPLYDFYKDRSFKRILQDVYDRFFTRIEHRYSKKDIQSLNNFFKEVTISENLPYWHFLCEK